MSAGLSRLVIRIGAVLNGADIGRRSAMPDQIYKACQACPRLYACEVAMVKGPLPNMAVLGNAISIPQPKLAQVQLPATLERTSAGT